ncbi:copper resistance protein NlpE N-terminal domain-containing protein [Lysobacter korlensis]|uniref:Copper resistance protein NlpE N-terminal domain-containing protein n=1 Tax=Lysobacter korlensis TaxID=553636 RepID=A0ABV6RI84_9GAMM
MAEINIERKKSIWPWIIAALIAALLIWAAMEFFDRDEPVDDTVGAVTADQTAAAPAAVAPATTEPVAPDAAAIAAAGTTPAAGTEGFAGTYISDSMQLSLTADGAYVMQESAAGEGRGTWIHEANANALHLKPADGSQDRYFRVEGPGTLIPLNPDGQPAAQMAPLNRRATQ